MDQIQYPCKIIGIDTYDDKSEQPHISMVLYNENTNDIYRHDIYTEKFPAFQSTTERYYDYILKYKTTKTSLELAKRYIEHVPMIDAYISYGRGYNSDIFSTSESLRNVSIEVNPYNMLNLSLFINKKKTLNVGAMLEYIKCRHASSQEAFKNIAFYLKTFRKDVYYSMNASDLIMLTI